MCIRDRVKLVWYHWNAAGKPHKRKIISRLKSYHGSSCAAICLTGKPEFHAGFGMPWPGFLYTDCADYYHGRRAGETQEQYSQRLADSLESLILAEGPETIGAFFSDALQCSAGVLAPPSGYYEKVQAILREYDILYVADEVITGFGRTGRMWACETYGISPDIITCAKALSAGMQPISAVLLNERIFQSMLVQSDRLGRFVHGYTYSGHPVAAAVALETLKIYEEMDLVGRVQAMEPLFLEAFGALMAHPLVGDFNGVGLIGGIELVADKLAGRPFPAKRDLGGMLDANAQKRGLILRLIGDRVALSPALVVTAAELREIARRLRLALDDTLAELGGELAA